jgi:pimeloyl-ACP methyl ester carboxylesterase
MSKHVRVAVLVTAVVALLGACSHHGGGGFPPPHGSKPPKPTTTTTTTVPETPPANPGTIRASGPASGKTPVIFLHGYSEEDTAMWNVAVEKFKAAGYTTGDYTLEVYDSHTKSASDVAAELAIEVDWLTAHTGKPKVDIVAHSLGDLITKACVVQGGCAGKVAHWENLAGAQNGTEVALQCPEPACVDMYPGSALITALAAADEPAIEAQGVKVQVQWTPNDGVIVPATNSQELEYADNVQVDGSLTHLTIFADPGVIDRALTFLAS